MSVRHQALIALGLLAASSAAGAQQARRPSAPARPQIGGIAPAPSSNRPAADDRHGRDDDGRRGERWRDGDDRDGDRRDGRGHYDAEANGAGIHGWVPAVVGRDGRVYVNLGYGYELVTQSCSVPFGGYVAGASGTSSGYTGTGYAPPSYSPPTYSAPTYSAPSYSSPSGSSTASPAPSTGAISQPLPDPTSHPVPDPNSHPVPGMPRVPGVAPGAAASYSYPPRGHHAAASCYASGPQGPAVLWH